MHGSRYEMFFWVIQMLENGFDLSIIEKATAYRQLKFKKCKEIKKNKESVDYNTAIGKKLVQSSLEKCSQH